MNKNEWFNFLRKLYEEKVSAYSECKDFFKSIGKITFQFEFEDNPEYSFWQEYTGEKIILHEGKHPKPTLTGITTIDVFMGTLSRKVNVMNAAAKGKYKMKGHMGKLMKMSGILPYVERGYWELKNDRRRNIN